MNRNPFVTFVMVLLGIILLLPGLCAIVFMGSVGSGDSAILLLWLVCLGFRPGGVALIVSAIRGPRRS